VGHDADVVGVAHPWSGLLGSAFDSTDTR
jgi:hypothetical protein